jgi:predicted ArsR family transcriptional regulator
MKTKGEIIDWARGLMSPAQKRFYDAYMTSGKSVSRAAQLLGITHQGALKHLRGSLVSGLVELEGITEIVNSEPVPSTEWLQVQYKRLYDKAVADGNEELQDKYLKRIQDFKKQFGDMIDEEQMKISAMTSDQLIEFTEEVIGDLKQFRDKWQWTKDAITKTDNDSEVMPSGNPSPA